MFRLAKLSVANRSVVALITVITAIFGFISLGALKQELVPSFAVPQAAIVTAYPGASPEVIDDQVSKVIEGEVRKIDGLVNSTSTSQSNISIVRVEFAYGTTTAKVSELLAAAIAKVKSNLPADVEPNVLSGSFDSVPIIALGVSANNGNNEAIAQTLSDIATPLFSQVKGVRDVNIAGVKEKRINLAFKTAVMAANGLTQQSIVSALQSNGFVIPAGTIDDEKGSISVEVGTPVNSLEEFKSLALVGSASSSSSSGFSGFPGGSQIPSGISIPSAAKSSALTIADVATVTLENAPTTSIARTNGKEALSISIVKTQDGNTVAVSHGVQSKIAELKKKLGNTVGC